MRYHFEKHPFYTNLYEGNTLSSKGEMNYVYRNERDHEQHS